MESQVINFSSKISLTNQFIPDQQVREAVLNAKIRSDLLKFCKDDLISNILVNVTAILDHKTIIAETNLKIFELPMSMQLYPHNKPTVFFLVIAMNIDVLK